MFLETLSCSYICKSLTNFFHGGVGRWGGSSLSLSLTLAPPHVPCSSSSPCAFSMMIWWRLFIPPYSSMAPHASCSCIPPRTSHQLHWALAGPVPEFPILDFPQWILDLRLISRTTFEPIVNMGNLVLIMVPRGKINYIVVELRPIIGTTFSIPLYFLSTERKMAR
jgi:hypothetical protein